MGVYLRSLASLSLVLGTVGCTTVGEPWYVTAGDAAVSDVDGTKTELSFSLDILPILEAGGCANAGCHNGVDRSMGLDVTTITGLTSPAGSDKIAVIPCDPEGGTLLDKLSASPSFGIQMPIGADPLAATEISLIRQWILEGAAENWSPDSCL